jgi:DNA-binding NtrC family response regulator
LLAQRKILLISGHQQETDILQGFLNQEVTLDRVENIMELDGALERAGYDAVLCEWSCPGGGTWNDVLTKIQQRHSALPVIVFCRTGGEREWLQVLEAGAFDLLCSPYSKAATVAVLQHAIASYDGWKRIQQNPPARQTRLAMERRSGIERRVHDRRRPARNWGISERRGAAERRYFPDRRVTRSSSF